MTDRKQHAQRYKHDDIERDILPVFQRKAVPGIPVGAEQMQVCPTSALTVPVKKSHPEDHYKINAQNHPGCRLLPANPFFSAKQPAVNKKISDQKEGN